LVVDKIGRDISTNIELDQTMLLRTEIEIGGKGDLQTVTGRDNMVQAIRNRLGTRVGELDELGHPDYGSYLDMIVGEPNIPDTHRIIEALVRDCLNQDPRIESILDVRVGASDEDKRLGRVMINVDIRIIETSERLRIEYPFTMEG